MGLVRYDDGTDWELRYGYWNGTTITRPSNIVASSTGSALSLTSAATASMVVDPAEFQPHLAGVTTRGFVALVNSASAPTAFGTSGPTSNLGTGGAINPTTTSVLTEQPRAQLTSATTASAQSGWASTNIMCVSNTTAGRGGGEFTSRFGVSSIPTGPRLFVGLSSATFAAQTIEPSAFTAHVAAFAKDSTDTNIQFLTNSNAGAGTKIDTGIPFPAGGVYEATVWFEPGAAAFYGLLLRLDTGDIYYGSTTTDIPGTAALMPNCIAGLNGTNTGTAIVFCPSTMLVRPAI